jgi:hypothetical protein
VFGVCARAGGGARGRPGEHRPGCRHLHRVRRQRAAVRRRQRRGAGRARVSGDWGLGMVGDGWGSHILFWVLELRLFKQYASAPWLARAHAGGGTCRRGCDAAPSALLSECVRGMMGGVASTKGVVCEDMIGMLMLLCLTQCAACIAIDLEHARGNCAVFTRVNSCCSTPSGLWPASSRL